MYVSSCFVSLVILSWSHQHITYSLCRLVATMYESETWELRNAEQKLLERIMMRMLRWMMGIKRIENIRNEEIRASVGVADIREKIKRSETEMVRPCGEKH